MAEASRRYYGSGRLGRDFATAPHVSPAFGHLLGRALAAMWRGLDRPSRFIALEVGAGGGVLGRDVLAYLSTREPDAASAIRYVTADAHASSIDVVCDVEALPFGEMVGTILSNELFDALPVHRLTADGELWVEGGERFVEGPRSSPDLADIGVAPGHVLDVSLTAGRVIRQFAGALQRGYVLTIDYGATRDELRAPHRRAGTALAFHRHAANIELLARPGEQDLTAHVDFDQLRRSGDAVGLRTLLYTSQRDFLLRLGLDEWLGRLDPARLTPADLVNARLRARELIRLDGFGKFRVLIQARGMAELPLELDVSARLREEEHGDGDEGIDR